MEVSKKENILTALLWIIGAAVLAITAYTVLIRGPLRTVLEDELTFWMLGEVLVLFLWNLLCLGGTGRKRLRILGLLGGIVLFTWCHRIFLPLLVSGVYMAVLVLAGKQVLGLILKGIVLPLAETVSMSLVLGSALWMVLVCLISLTGHGGLTVWRGLAAVMALSAAALEARCGRRKRRPAAGEWWHGNKVQGCLLAFIITMVLIQAGRMNIELDYDSLHYGLRSAYVLDNGKGIYEDLGMINLVYTYSKGLEVLVLPLSGTPTYGFVLAFSLWCTVGILLLTAHMVGRYCGSYRGMWAAAAVAAIPGIMNMAATAKSDNITLLHQLIIYDLLCCAMCVGNARDVENGGRGGNPGIHGPIAGDRNTASRNAGSANAGRRNAGSGNAGSTNAGSINAASTNAPWLLMAVGAYLLTLVYKPTALVFSTALGGVALFCFMAGRRLRVSFGTCLKRGWLLLILPGAAAAGLWYRTWLLTGVPVTSIFAGFFERAGCAVKYPFTFTHVIGDPSALTAGEKLSRLGARLQGMMLAPVSEDMAHVIIAWGTGLVTLFLFIWAGAAVRRDRDETVKELDFFDRVLVPVLALGSIASIYTLSQVDGNYFILFYALLVISALRMWGCGNRGNGLGKRILPILVPFFLMNTVITCTTGWAGTPGFTPVSLRHRGYYDHRRDITDKRIREGNLTLASMFSPRSRVLAFGEHPGVLDLPCSVQSYYDVTGSGGNVYLVKRLAYFEEFLKYAGTEYFFVETGYLAGQGRARQIIEDMIVEGSLSEMRYEWGNMAARVTLDAPPPDDPEAALMEFREKYSMMCD